ncbi:hypothetical protein ACWFNE_18775 [Cellulomonas sp. NPDC055163]
MHVGAALAVLRASEPGRTVRLTSVRATTVAELADWARAEADALAAAFDRRNGTDHVSRLVARAWRTTAAPEPLELAVIPAQARRRDRDTAGTDLARAAGASDAAASTPPVGGPDVADLLRRASQLVDDGDPAAAAPLYLEAAQHAEDAGLLADAGAALAEAARCAQVLDDHEGASWAYSRATTLLRAGGADPLLTAAVVRTHARSAADLGRADAALAEVEQCLDELAAPGGTAGGAEAPADVPGAAELAERRRAEVDRERAELDDCAARLLATLGRDGEAAARAAAAGEAFGVAGHVADASHAFWLAGRLHADAGVTDAAVEHLESAVEGFGLVRDRDLRAQAAALLIDVLRRAGRDREADDVARVLTD